MSKKKRYADNEWPGNGIIKCEACDKPLRDHPIRPCEQLGQDLIRAPRPSTRGRRNGEHPDTRRRAEYRRKKTQ